MLLEVMIVTLKERIRAKAVIQELAQREGKSPEEIRRSMQECIDEAWDNKTQTSAAAWLRYFPDGKKPTLEEFMCRLAKELK